MNVRRLGAVRASEEAARRVDVRLTRGVHAGRCHRHAGCDARNGTVGHLDRRILGHREQARDLDEAEDVEAAHVGRVARAGKADEAAGLALGLDPLHAGEGRGVHVAASRAADGAASVAPVHGDGRTVRGARNRHVRDLEHLELAVAELLANRTQAEGVVQQRRHGTGDKHARDAAGVAALGRDGVKTGERGGTAGDRGGVELALLVEREAAHVRRIGARDDRACAAPHHAAGVIVGRGHREGARHLRTQDLGLAQAREGKEGVRLALILRAEQALQQAAHTIQQIRVLVVTRAEVHRPAERRRTSEAARVGEHVGRAVLNARGRDVDRTRKAIVHRVAASHGARKAAGIRATLDRDVRSERGGRDDALRNGKPREAWQVYAQIGERALHHVVADDARKAAGVCLGAHGVGDVTLYIGVGDDGTGLHAREAASVVLASGAQDGAAGEVYDARFRDRGVVVGHGEQLARLDDVVVEQQGDEVAQA